MQAGSMEEAFAEFLGRELLQLQERVVAEHKRRLAILRGDGHGAEQHMASEFSATATVPLSKKSPRQPESSASPASARGRACRWDLLLVAAIMTTIGLLLAADSQLLSGPFLLDDGPKIRDNPEIRSVGTALMKPRRGIDHPTDDLRYNDPSRPLTSLTFQLNYWWGGLQPRSFRVVNLGVHWLNSVLVFFLAQTLTAAVTLRSKCARADPAEDGTREALVGPLLASCLFLASPLNHGTALYIYARSDLLCTAGVLAFSILGLRRRLQAVKNRHTLAAGEAIFTAGAMLMFLLAALLSKQVAVSAPLGLGILDLALIPAAPLAHTGSSLSEGLRQICRCLLRQMLWAAVVCAYLCTRLFFLGMIGDAEMRSSSEAPVEGLVCYWASQPYAAVRYAATLFVPKQLAIDHQVLSSSLCASLVEWSCGLALFALAVAMTVSLLCRSTTRGPLESLALAGLGWFVAHLLPSSIPRTADIYVERRPYLASAGLYASFALAWWAVSQSLHRTNYSAAAKSQLRFRCFEQGRLAMLACPALMLAYFVAVGRSRNTVFYDRVAPWREVVSLYPEGLRGRNNLGTALLERLQDIGETRCMTCADEARAIFSAVLAQDPANSYAMMNLAELEHLRENMAASNAWFYKVLAVDSRHAHAHFKLGSNLQHMREDSAAKNHYQAALQLDPTMKGLHNNMAVLYAEAGDCARAVQIWIKGNAAHPQDSLLLANRDAILSCGSTDDQEEAVAQTPRASQAMAAPSMAGHNAAPAHVATTAATAAAAAVSDAARTSQVTAEASMAEGFHRDPSKAVLPAVAAAGDAADTTAPGPLRAERVRQLSSPGAEKSAGLDLVRGILDGKRESLSGSIHDGLPKVEVFIVVLSCQTCDHGSILDTWWPRGSTAVRGKVFVGGGPQNFADLPDIVKLDVVDDYKGVPMKFLAALRWLFDHYEPRFVLKVHHDVYVRADSVVERLAALPDDRDLYQGLVSEGMPRQRHPDHKSYIPDEVYADAVLPTYIHGAAVLLSRSTARHLSKLDHLIFPDDVGMAIAFQRLGVKPTRDTMFWGGYPQEQCFGSGPDVLVDLYTEEMHLLHRSAGGDEFCRPVRALWALRVGAYFHEEVLPCGPCRKCRAARIIEIRDADARDRAMNATASLALGYYDEALQLEPEYKAARLSRAMMLVVLPQQHIMAVALTHLEALPGAEARLAESGLLLRLGRVDDSSEALMKIAKLNEGGCSEADAAFVLGYALQSGEGEFEHIRTSYERAIRIDPSHSGAWNNLALLLHIDGKIEEAASTLRSALKLFPADAMTLNTRESMGLSAASE